MTVEELHHQLAALIERGLGGWQVLDPDFQLVTGIAQADRVLPPGPSCVRLLSGLAGSSGDFSPEQKPGGGE